MYWIYKSINADFVVQFVVCFGVFFVVILMLSRRGIVLVSFVLQFIRRIAEALGHLQL
jgi:hypothetical protein